MYAPARFAGQNHDFKILEVQDLYLLSRTGEAHVSFGLYLVGYIVLVVGLALAAHLLHVPPRWIGVGIICMVGLGILTGVTTTRHRDPPV